MLVVCYIGIELMSVLVVKFIKDFDKVMFEI